MTACSTTVTGAAYRGTASPAAARPAFGAYLDVSVKRPDLAAVAKNAGLKHVNLSFALALNGACEPGGAATSRSTRSSPKVDAFRAAGWLGLGRPGRGCGQLTWRTPARPPGDLAGAYRKLMDAYGTNLLDVDIEAGVDTTKVVEGPPPGAGGARHGHQPSPCQVDIAGIPAEAAGLVQKAAAANVPVNRQPSWR